MTRYHADCTVGFARTLLVGLEDDCNDLLDWQHLLLGLPMEINNDIVRCLKEADYLLARLLRNDATALNDIRQVSGKLRMILAHAGIPPCDTNQVATRCVSCGSFSKELNGARCSDCR